MGLSTLDLMIVLAYLVGIFVLAQVVSREEAGHRKSASDYFLAGKALPWWAIGASLIAANISAEQIKAGALAAAIGSFLLSIMFKLAWPELPFMDRVGMVFLLSLTGGYGFPAYACEGDARTDHDVRNRLSHAGQFSHG